MDVFGKALLDFYQSGEGDKLWIHNNYGKPENMPVEVFFRTEADMPDLEEYALALCKGRVLDIGAGVGAHSLILGEHGFKVSSLEISAAACQIMEDRGVRDVINGDIFSTQGEYDTLLMLMNGIGLCGDIDGLNTLLPHLRTLLSSRGQIILDSSDIAYLYEPGNFSGETYYGEISYQYEYQRTKGDWFKWLYIDFDTLKTIAAGHGFSCELLFEDDMDQYLARLVPIR